jgi:hypothetical protein
MPVFLVTFRREFSVSVQAEDRAEVEAAAKSACDDNLRDWDPRVDWWPTVFDAYNPTSRVLKADHGVVDGEIVNIEDYRKARGG